MLKRLVTTILTVFAIANLTGCATGTALTKNDKTKKEFIHTGTVGSYYSLDSTADKVTGIDSIAFSSSKNEILVSSTSFSLYNEYSGPELSNGEKTIVDVLKSERTGKREWRPVATQSITLVIKGQGIEKKIHITANKNGLLTTPIATALSGVNGKGPLTLTCESCTKNFSKQKTQISEIPNPPKVTTQLMFNSQDDDFSNAISSVIDQQRVKDEFIAATEGDAAIIRIKLSVENERVAREGDSSPEDILCKKYGFKPNSDVYKQCRLQIDIAKQQATQQQEIYDQQKNQYDAQVAAAKNAREQRKNEALLEMGFRMMSGQSPINAAASVGTGAPIGPPPVPMSTRTYTLPGNKSMTCTTTGNMTNCF